MSTEDRGSIPSPVEERRSGDARRPFSPWTAGPLIICVLSLSVAIASGSLWATRSFSNPAACCYLAGLLYFVAQVIGRLVFRQWKAACFALLSVGACCLAVIPAMVVGMMLLFNDHDGFADQLTIPANIEISRPLAADFHSVRGEEDSFQHDLVASLSRPPGPVAQVTPTIPALRQLAMTQRPLLLRYLESSPAWRVYEEHGGLYATRRWEFGSRWMWSLHGYYTPSLPYPFGIKDAKTPNFQTRTSLDLNGRAWMPTKGVDWMEEGSGPNHVRLRPDNEMDSSTCFIRCGGGMQLEIFEQSPGPGRRMTQAAMDDLELEFAPVAGRPSFDPALLPKGSIEVGAPKMDLYDGMQPGIYDAEIRINPGEPGLIYLKAFEITRNYELSADRLKESSNERIGWSSNPRELFLSSTNIMIYEGDWGHPYAARFEVWFQPERGGLERKLLSRNFIIEGWER